MLFLELPEFADIEQIPHGKFVGSIGGRAELGNGEIVTVIEIEVPHRESDQEYQCIATDIAADGALNGNSPVPHPDVHRLVIIVHADVHLIE